MIQQNNHTPIIVGGTGYYVDALLGRITLPEVKPNSKLRTQLEKKSVEELFSQLKKIDPRRAHTIEPTHKRRLIRAIEIAKALGKNPVPTPQKKYQVLWLGLCPPLEKLQKNISTRLTNRMRMGMVAEAKRLHAKGLSYRRMEELGLEYRYLSLLQQKKIDRAQFHAELERAIQHYAKRQIRWFRRNSDVHWISGKQEALQLTKRFLSRSTIAI